MSGFYIYSWWVVEEACELVVINSVVSTTETFIDQINEMGSNYTIALGFNNGRRFEETRSVNQKIGPIFC